MLPFPNRISEKERCDHWIAALYRNVWRPGVHFWLCSAHFISRKKSDDPLSPDYTPSIFCFIPSLLKREYKAHGAVREIAAGRLVADTVVGVDDTDPKFCESLVTFSFLPALFRQSGLYHFHFARCFECLFCCARMLVL